MLTTRSTKELVSCYCWNNSHLSWEDVLKDLIMNENSQVLHKPLDTRQLIDIATTLSENISVSINELPITSDAAKQQVLQKMPVMLVTQNGSSHYINIHEFVFTPGLFEAFLNSDKEAEETGHVSADLQNSEEHENTINPCNNMSKGQPSLVKKFQSIVDKTAEFVKQHGFAAQQRRRTETGYSSGVTIRQIREYLIKDIEGLKEHGISQSTIRRLFNAPNRSHTASKAWCSLDTYRRLS